MLTTIRRKIFPVDIPHDSMYCRETVTQISHLKETVKKHSKVHGWAHVSVINAMRSAGYMVSSGPIHSDKQIAFSVVDSELKEVEKAPLTGVCMYYNSPDYKTSIAYLHMKLYAHNNPKVTYVIKKETVGAIGVKFFRNGILVDDVLNYTEDDWKHHSLYLIPCKYHEIVSDVELDKLMDEHWYTGVFFTNAKLPIDDMIYMKLQLNKICEKQFHVEKTAIVAYRDHWIGEKYQPHTSTNKPCECVGYFM